MYKEIRFAGLSNEMAEMYIRFSALGLSSPIETREDVVELILGYLQDKYMQVPTGFDYEVDDKYETIRLRRIEW